MFQVQRDALSKEAIIEELALSYGIEPEYVDNWGHTHRTSVEIKKKILRAMGVVADTAEQAKEAWLCWLERKWSRLAEPTIVVNLHDPPEALFFQVPVRAEGVRADELKVCLTITDEQGVTQKISYTQKDLSFSETMHLTSRICDRWSMPFPKMSALGYYSFHLSVTVGDQDQSQTIFVAVCPDKAYIPPALQGDGRTAGIAISLYGVRSGRNWGIGDFGDLKQIVDWVSEDLHGGIIGLNPLHATFNRSPFNTSPYLPISRLYRNFIYLDIPAIEDYAASAKVQAMMQAPQTQELLSQLSGSKRVQYERVAALKENALRQVFQAFLKNHWNNNGTKTDRQKELEAYIQREGQPLENFATFSALDSTIRSRNPELWTWPQWPPEYHRPHTEAVQRFRQEHWKEVLFYKYVQWQLEKQLAQTQEYAKSRGMCVGLYHDLALAIDRFGADFWAYQDCFVPGARVGAPPDAFSQNGQDWGFPPPNTERLREDGYNLFIRELQKNCAAGGALRIDHVMRFFRLYCIPEGESPTKGAYVLQSVDDLLRILALESVRNRVVIIGEDLGTVPTYIRKRLSEANVFSYRLLYFEKDDQQDFIQPQDYPELALVTVSTHDLPTLAGFWTHKDIKIRAEAGMFGNVHAATETAVERETDKEKLLRLSKDLGLLAEHCSGDPTAYPKVTSEIHNAVVGFLALTPAKLFVLSQEDLFKDTDQQNLPGTTSEYPNWCLKMKYRLEQLRTDPAARAFSKMFRTWIDKSERKRTVM
jgi:4-alpha-glucanotransferase